MRAAKQAAATLGGNRGDIHNRAALFPAHVGNDGLTHIQRAAQIHIEHRIIILRRDRHNVARLGNAGIVDEHMHRAEIIEHCGDSRDALFMLGDIAAIALVASAMQGGGGEFRLLGIQIKHDNLRALFGKTLRNGAAKATL